MFLLSLSLPTSTNILRCVSPCIPQMLLGRANPRLCPWGFAEYEGEVRERALLAPCRGLVGSLLSCSPSGGRLASLTCTARWLSASRCTLPWTGHNLLFPLALARFQGISWGSGGRDWGLAQPGRSPPSRSSGHTRCWTWFPGWASALKGNIQEDRGNTDVVCRGLAALLLGSHCSSECTGTLT